MRSCAALSSAAVVLGLGATALLLTAPAASADGLPTPTLSKTTVSPGETFTISGSGCLPYDEEDWVSVWVLVPNMPSTTPATDGTWSVTGREETTFAGSYPVRATCFHGEDPNETYPAVSIRVDAPPQWWQTCGPLPGNPGVTGCPGPNLSLPPPAQRTRTTAPRTTGAPPPAVRTTTPAPVPPLTTLPPPVAPTPSAGATALTPAAGCRDCARLTGARPVAPGDRLELSYTGFGPGERVAVVLHSTPVRLGTFAADASGAVTASIAIPSSLEAGSHTLTLTGALTGDRVVGFRLAGARTTRPATAAGTSSGPSAALPLTLAGGGVALLGAAAALVLRRRRAATIG